MATNRELVTKTTTEERDQTASTLSLQNQIGESEKTQTGSEVVTSIGGAQTGEEIAYEPVKMILKFTMSTRHKTPVDGASNPCD
jgi:hypothetical protein